MSNVAVQENGDGKGFATEAYQTAPLFWFGLPHGFIELDLQPTLESVDRLIDQVRSLPEEDRVRTEGVVRFYAGVVTMLNQQNTHAAAVGLHPDEDAQVSFSVLTISSVPSHGVDPKLVLASMVSTSAGRGDHALEPWELPCGMGFVTEEEHPALAPGKGSGGEAEEEMTVWRGTVAATAPDTPDITVLQLVTPAIHRAADYRDVLLGIAATVTFTDPAVGTVTGSEECQVPQTTSTVKDVFG